MVRCEECIYWEPMGDKKYCKFGWCHRHAPSPLSSGDTSWRWPLTSRTEWCGEGCTKEGGKDGHAN